MDIDHRPQRAPTVGTPATTDAMTPGKRTLTESLAVPSHDPASAPDAQLTGSGTAASAPSPLLASASSRSRPALQMLFGGRPADPAQVHAAAARDTATPASTLPYADPIQRAAGRHDTSAIQDGEGGAPSLTPGPGRGRGDGPDPSAASGASVQRKQLPSRDEEPATPALAGVADGIAGAGSPLPHLETIQRAFGPAHDLASVRAHVGGSAATSATGISAEAYAVGSHVAFRTAPDLRLAAHEAAHVVQQRSGAVAPGLGQAGDAHERAADDVAERVARGEVIEHLLPAGSESAPRAVQRRKLDNGDVIPDDLQVSWAGDPFTIRFDHRAGSPDGRFVFTLHYTGPHPVDGPFIDKTAKVVSISAGPIGAQTLAATVVRQVGTTLTVDLYGDNTTLVKLIDKPGFDPPAALNSGRRHTLGIEVNGTPRADSAGIWIKDPAASPIAASTIQDDVPGENPQSWMNITAGGVVDEMRIDGDGDQSKELLVGVSAKDYWPDPERKDVARHVKVEVKQLSSAQTRSFELELPRPTSLGSLFPLVREVTDGKAPTRISLVLPTDSQLLTIDPPTHDGADVVYGAHTLGKSFPLRFPAEAKGTLPIAGANTPAPIIGGISSVDLRLGYYGDQFRVTVQPTGSGSALFGISALTRGEPIGGAGATLKLTAPLRLGVVPGDSISVGLDLDGDGKVDLSFFDRLTTPDGGSPERSRDHQVRVAGPPIGEKTFAFTVRDALMSGGYLISSGGYANPSDADMNALSNASAAVGLAKQAGGGSGAPATLEGDIDGFENRLGEVRQTAMQKGLIQKATFEAWLRLSTAFIKLSPQIRANAVKPEAQSAGADAAAALYQALKAETDPTETMKMGSTTWNAHTGEMATRKSGQGMGPDAWSVRGFGPEFSDDVRAGRWVKVNEDYHKLVGGFDRWVVKRLKDTGNAQFAAQAEAFGQMRDQLHTLDGKQAKRLYAVFHSEEQLKTDGRLTEVPLSLYYWREGDTWHLKDLTNPANPFDDTLAVGKPDETEPSDALFAKLDAKIHFPKGIIHYQIPGGRGGQVKTTAPTSWHDYLAYIGMGVALIGTTLVTFGTGTVVVAGTWILAGSGVIGAVAAGGDLAEHLEHGNLDATTAVIDIAQIVAGLAGAAALAQGAIMLDAANAAKAGTPWAGKWAQLAVFGEKTKYIPLGTKVAADVVTVVAMADKAAVQLDQIENSGGSRADRDRAKAQLLAQFALSGGLVALSIKGDLGTLGKGRTLRLHMPEDGPPVALLSGMEAPTGLKFSQKDVGPKTGDGKLTIEQMTENMKKGGWNGDPIHVVELADGSKVSLDNRRLLAAQNAGLKEIPVLYHSPAEKVDPKWAERGFELEVNIRKLDDGSLVVGGTQGGIVYEKEAIPSTYGEAALFRTANQGNLKGARTRFPLYGSYDQPVVRRPKAGSGPPPQPE